MKVQKYLNMIRKVKSTSFATIGLDGNPKVRIIDVMGVEEETLYFLTSRGKDFYQELMTHNKVAITVMNNNWQTVRIEGAVEFIGQDRLKKIFQDNPSMNQVYPGESRRILEVFCIRNGNGEFFDLSDKPIYRESFQFGKGEIKKKGFTIQETCIACGICTEECPQQCITAGEIYEIAQEHCLHCGLCREVCPADAVARFG